MERYRNYGQRRSILTFVVIGVLIFIFVYFPFFATNLRYTVGSSFSIIFDAIGSLFIIVGGLFLAIGIFEIFSRGHNWIRKVLIGAVLLYIGCWLTGTVLTFMGFEYGDSTSSGGYH